MSNRSQSISDRGISMTAADPSRSDSAGTESQNLEFSLDVASDGTAESESSGGASATAKKSTKRIPRGTLRARLTATLNDLDLDQIRNEFKRIVETGDFAPAKKEFERLSKELKKLGVIELKSAEKKVKALRGRVQKLQKQVQQQIQKELKKISHAAKAKAGGSKAPSSRKASNSKGTKKRTATKKKGL